MQLKDVMQDFKTLPVSKVLIARVGRDIERRSYRSRTRVAARAARLDLIGLRPVAFNEIATELSHSDKIDLRPTKGSYTSRQLSFLLEAASAAAPPVRHHSLR